MVYLSSRIFWSSYCLESSVTKYYKLDEVKQEFILEDSHPKLNCQGPPGH